MPRLRRSATPVRATAYPETRTDAGQYALTPEAIKRVYYAKPPLSDTNNRVRFGRGLNMDRIESALRAAQFGAMRDLCDLARETVATDPHLAAILQKRINAVASLPFDIVPADGPGVDPKKAEANAELVRVQIGRIPHFRQALKQLAWGLFDGRSALEIQWLLRPSSQATKTGGPYQEPKQDWVAADLIFIHPRRLQFGPARELRLSDQMSTTGFQPVGVALQEFPFKFVQFKPQLFGDYPELEGLAPRCLYWSFFKRFGQRDRMQLLELFGKPWRVVTTTEESQAGPEDLMDAELAADALGGTNTVRMPRGVALDVVQPGDTAGKVHAEVIAESDKQNSKLVLGQTGTTDAQNSGLGSNQPVVMAAEQLLILQGDAELLSDAVEDGLADAIVALNRGVDELVNAPRFVLRAEVPTDRTKEAQRVKAALDTGVELAADEAYEVMGFRKPTPQDVTISMTSVPNGDGTSTIRAVMNAPLDPEAAKAIENADAEFGQPLPGATPTAGEAPVGGAQFTLAPTDLASVIKVNEARQSAGLGPLTTATGAPDPDGELTVSAFQAKSNPAPAPFGGAPKPAPTEPAPDGSAKPEPNPEPPAPKAPEPKPPAGEAPPLPEPDGTTKPAPKPEASLPAPLNIAATAAAWEERLVLEGRGISVPAGPHQHDGHSVALEKSRQPATVHGTLEDLIDKGVKEASRINGRWGDVICAAVRGQTTAGGINRAIARAAKTLELNGYARAVERRVTHALMTGALDSAWEGETEEQIKPEAFTPPEDVKASRAELIKFKDLLTPETVEVEPEFTRKNYQAAVKYFTSKEPIPKSTFARLSASMKARSFTVAGLSAESTVETAHQELARALVEGSDLKQFSQQLADRFESAGMTPLNPSHAENVFRTNMLDSYNIGRRAEMSQPSVLKARPYWLIRTVTDSRQRKTHGAVNNWVLRADDPFWTKGGPPWGYQCRCRLTAIREAKAQQLGIRSGAEVRGLPDDGFTPNALNGSDLSGLLNP